MKYILCICIFLLVSLVNNNKVNAQNQSAYIYGKITTHSGEEYVGFMRWGKEEVFWHDIFNSEKVDDHSYKVAKKSDNKSNNKWYDFDWNWSSIWEDKYQTTSHTFACFFGDIKLIKVLHDNRVNLELKNGISIKLNGGSNDIGADIKLTDYELGLISFNWDKIDKIEFSQATPRVSNPHAKAIYGTVSTRRAGEFTGFIKWDLDERTLDDVLDGDSHVGEQKIPFKSIRSITKEGNGASVTLQSGREIFVSGSNDVNNSNRGIAVYHHDLGSVEIPWKDFRSLTIHNDIPNGPAYNDFEAPKGISGKVVSYNNKTYEGMLLFDIDEMYEIELLDGNDDSVEFQIPFRNITEIIPKNSSYSIVKLKSGKELLLGETQDVSSKNDGILVFKEKQEDPYYIQWDDIDYIVIRH